MIGILSVGGRVPRYRLSGKALGAVWGGGRFDGQLTDCDPATVGFEMPEGEGFISYFWKFRPA